MEGRRWRAERGLFLLSCRKLDSPVVQLAALVSTAWPRRNADRLNLHATVIYKLKLEDFTRVRAFVAYRLIVQPENPGATNTRSSTDGLRWIMRSGVVREDKLPMAQIIFRCPATSMNVQHWLDEDASSSSGREV